MRQRSILIVTIVILAILDIVIELQILPLFYKDLPLPFPETSKPIGSSLFTATSLHLTLIAANLLILMLIMTKINYKGVMVISKKSDWLDLFALLILAISGIVMWFYPIFMLSFIVCGIYLVFAEMN